MRHNQAQNSKRARGRGRRNNTHGQTSFNRNTTFESNGPEGRLRGNAQQLFEKYTALAHDAHSAGERVSAEAFTQFADHYYRIYQSVLQASEQQKKAHEERIQARRREQSDENLQPSDDNGAEDVSAAEASSARTPATDTAGSDADIGPALDSQAAKPARQPRGRRPKAVADKQAEGEAGPSQTDDEEQKASEAVA